MVVVAQWLAAQASNLGSIPGGFPVLFHFPSIALIILQAKQSDISDGGARLINKNMVVIEVSE